MSLAPENKRWELPEDRRQQSRRRSAELSIDDEKRQVDDRRLTTDRRGHYVNLFSNESAFVYEALLWLTDNIEGEWGAGPKEHRLEECEAACRVRFEHENDLQAFVSWLEEWDREHPTAPL